MHHLNSRGCLIPTMRYKLKGSRRFDQVAVPTSSFVSRSPGCSRLQRWIKNDNGGKQNSSANPFLSWEPKGAPPRNKALLGTINHWFPLGSHDLKPRKKSHITKVIKLRPACHVSDRHAPITQTFKSKNQNRHLMQKAQTPANCLELRPANATERMTPLLSLPLGICT